MFSLISSTISKQGPRHNSTIINNQYLLHPLNIMILVQLLPLFTLSVNVITCCDNSHVMYMCVFASVMCVYVCVCAYVCVFASVHVCVCVCVHVA